jgi:thiol-disulfide isomerase/thioredoxin
MVFIKRERACMKIKTILGILLLGLLVVGAAYNFGEKQKQVEQIKDQAIQENATSVSPDEMVETGPKVGAAAPNFDLETLSGEKVKLSDLRGKKVLVNFWATWCGPCREEMPDLEKFYQEFKGENIEVIAVNLTSYELKEENVREFVDTFEMSFSVLLDSDGAMYDQYQVYYVPTNYFINEKGIITKKTGPLTYDQMVKFYQEAFVDEG